MQDIPENAVPPEEPKPVARRRGRAAATAPVEVNRQPSAEPSAPASAAEDIGTAGEGGKPTAPVEAAKTEPVAPAAVPPAATAAIASEGPPDAMAASLHAGKTALKTQTNTLAAYVTLATQWTQHWQTLLGTSLKLQQQLAQQVMSQAGQSGHFAEAFRSKGEKDR